MFDAYAAELSRIRLLEPAEEAALWQRYKTAADEEARALLIESYQPLVFKQVAQLHPQREVFMDLVQEGTVGLIEAVEQYDPSRGVAFSLYALHRVRGRMLNFLAKGREPPTVSLDTGRESGWAELLPADVCVHQDVERVLVGEEVRRTLVRLPQQEQAVLDGMFLRAIPARQLASELEMSLSHVYRLQKQGIRRVRGMLARFRNDLP